MWLKSNTIIILLVCMLSCPIVFASANFFMDLDGIVSDKGIPFDQAIKKIDSLLKRSIDPVFVKKLVLYSSEHAKSTYTYEQKEKYERYDEAIFIGMCRLIQMNTAESIRQLVDLIQYDLGVSNNEILGQRITEIGRPALLHLKTKLRELRKKEKTVNQESKHLASKRIRLIEGYIKYIKKGEKIDAGVGPCFTRGKD